MDHHSAANFTTTSWPGGMATALFNVMSSHPMTELVLAMGGAYPLWTHRVPTGAVPHLAAATATEGGPLFRYEAWIAAWSIFFFRTTVRPTGEAWWYSAGPGLLLAVLAFRRERYEHITAVELFSYAVTSIWLFQRSEHPLSTKSKKDGQCTSLLSRHSPDPSLRQSVVLATLLRVLAMIPAAFLSLWCAQWLCSPQETWIPWWQQWVPAWIDRTGRYLFPVDEMAAAWRISATFSPILTVWHQQMAHLFFVTFHIQVGMGFLGIDFLRSEQSRRNQLIRLDVADTATDPSSSSTPSSSSEARPPLSNGQNVVKTDPTGGPHDSTTASATEQAAVRRAQRFQRGAAPFIIMTALPYMFQIIFYGNMNSFAFKCVQHDLHRMVRLHQLFDRDHRLTAMATESATSPDAYAQSMNTIFSTAYEIFNRKLFSLPKVLLLPGVMYRQPMLVVQVFPFIFFSDWFKAGIMSVMTTKIEALQKEMHDLKAIRSKVEAFDIKNAELLQRSGPGATQFTQRRWEDLTVAIQSRAVQADLIDRSKGFFAFMQRNFIFTVLIDCALATLIAVGKIFSAEIFVYSRAIEDAVDMILTRSRGEAELARMMTEIQKLEQLDGIWQRSADTTHLPCEVGGSKRNLVIRNLHYSRGTASVRADHLELSPGVYALTGANGSGKSTLFRVLMSCSTNEKSLPLPKSINLHTPAEPLQEADDLMRETSCVASDANVDDPLKETTDVSLEMDGSVEEQSVAMALEPVAPSSHHLVHPKLSITMPSTHVVEISQTFYWPLYSKPIDWVYQEHVSKSHNVTELEEMVRRVAVELHALEFIQIQDEWDDTDREGRKEAVEESTIRKIMQELQLEKEDWFGDLSGGQRSKVELVRKVFLHEHCPEVLLVDETMAPLDPASKALVMEKMKSFCADSVIIVIYHTDVGRGKEVDGVEVDCVPANNFFDRNIHVEKGMLTMRETC